MLILWEEVQQCVGEKFWEALEIAGKRDFLWSRRSAGKYSGDSDPRGAFWKLKHVVVRTKENPGKYRIKVWNFWA